MTPMAPSQKHYEEQQDLTQMCQAKEETMREVLEHVENVEMSLTQSSRDFQ